MKYLLPIPSKLPSRLALVLLLGSLGVAAFAQAPDSVLIRGRILNLTPALYRDAPTVIFTRNNILQPQSELTRQAPLQADGSFEVKMPLIYPQEEVYLDYGGKVYTTFLASPGTLQLSFDADSMFSAKRLIYFAGVNAEANNQYIQYLMEEERLLKADRRFGEDFFEAFWEMDSDAAARALQRRTDLRLSALLPLAQRGTVSPLLRRWVTSTLREEQLSLLFEHALSRGRMIDNELKEEIGRLADGIMTFQRVGWAVRLNDYADRLLESIAARDPREAQSLKIERMVELIRRYVTNLSAEEKDRLDNMQEQGGASRDGLDFLNTLYARNRRTMDLVTRVEKRDRMYRENLGPVAADLLNAKTLVQQYYQLSLEEQSLLHDFIGEKISTPTIRQSFEEMYELEVRDSLYIDLVQKRNDLKASAPREVLSGIWLSQSSVSGKQWMKDILSLYGGRTLYVLKWNLFDDQSRNEVLYAPALRAQLPEDVEFLYIHLPNSSVVDSPDLWKKFIVRHKMKGVHLFLNENQAVQLMLRLNPLAYSTYGVIRPNGKYLTRNAPSPENGQRAAEVILRGLE